jgi:5'-3' exonuclease
MSDTEIKDRVEMIRIFIKNSWSWIEELAKRSNVLTMRLENLDADFIPELLLRQFDILEDDTVYVIFSGDGDMIQTIDFADNIKVFDGTTIITESNWLWSKKFFKFDGLKYPDVNPSCDKVILYKAVVGDSSDGIPGVKGVGNVRFYADILGAIPGDVRADDLPKMEHIFQQLADQKNKSAMKIVDNIETYRTCTKLVSFKVLIDYLRCDTNRYPSIKHRIDDNMQCLTESAKFLDVLKRKAV